MDKKSKKEKEIPILAGRPGAPDSKAGINSPAIVPPAFNPPVPNRAWTAMRQGKDIEELTEEEKKDLYLGPDNIL